MLTKIQKILNDNSQTISFIEKDHKYIELISGKFKEVPSVTTKLMKGEIGNPIRMTEHVVKAVDRGNYIHNVIETFLINIIADNTLLSIEHFMKIAEDLNQDFYCQYHTLLNISFAKICEIIREGYQLVSTEQVLYNKKYNIAGTVDAIFVDEDTNTILIIDWKTGQEKITDYAQVGIYEYMIKSLLDKEFPFMNYKKELVYIHDK